MDPVIQAQINKTMRELGQSIKPKERSRISKTSNGYIFLVAWSNASLLRYITKKFTDSLPKSLYRLKSQLDDACRSVVANIEEGYARQTTLEYINFLGYSRASLIEVKGDIQRSWQDGILDSAVGSSFSDLKINLVDWHESLKRTVVSPPNEIRGIYRNIRESKGQPKIQNSVRSFKFHYKPVDNLKVVALTYEMFIELINKTDWNIRKLVESLEKKLNLNNKFYQVEKLRFSAKHF